MPFMVVVRRAYKEDFTKRQGTLCNADDKTLDLGCKALGYNGLANSRRNYFEYIPPEVAANSAYLIENLTCPDDAVGLTSCGITFASEFWSCQPGEEMLIRCRDDDEEMGYESVSDVDLVKQNSPYLLTSSNDGVVLVTLKLANDQ